MSEAVRTGTTTGTIADAIAKALAMDAPVEQRLALVAGHVKALDPTSAAAVDRMAARLQGVGDTAPAVGTPMPHFALPTEDGQLATLASLLGEGPLVVVFLRGHWCPFCRITARALATTERTIGAVGGRVVAITPERRRYASALRAESGLSGPVLCDIDNGYALALGLALWVGEEIQALMEAGGRDLPRYQGSPAWLLPVPATFVLDPQGIVVERHIDPDYRHRMERDSILAAVRRAMAR